MEDTFKDLMKRKNEVLQKINSGKSKYRAIEQERDDAVEELMQMYQRQLDAQVSGVQELERDLDALYAEIEEKL